MGADGHLHYVSRLDWNDRWPDLKPSDCGLRLSYFAGVQYVLGYCDTEGRHFEDWVDMVSEENKPKVEAALNWFSVTSTRVELWT